jgi:hypothetical protein
MSYFFQAGMDIIQYYKYLLLFSPASRPCHSQERKCFSQEMRTYATKFVALNPAHLLTRKWNVPSMGECGILQE